MTCAFTFFVSTKNSLTWGVKCEKLNLKKNRREFIQLVKLRKLYMNGTAMFIWKFLAVLK